MDKMGHGMYTPMDTSLLPPLHLIYAENPSDSGKVVILFFRFKISPSLFFIFVKNKSFHISSFITLFSNLVDTVLLLTIYLCAHGCSEKLTTE